MSEPTSLPSSDSAVSSLHMQQHLTGDRNQAIGQVLGGMVVYVSGGQAVFHAGSTDSNAGASKASPPAVGPNPYKGLMAFQETDGDRKPFHHLSKSFWTEG